MKSEGACKYCNGNFSGQTMAKHLLSCVEREKILNKENTQDTKDKVFLIRTKNGPFFIYFEVNAAASLKEVDSFLRDAWLECCGHLSSFKIDGINYDSVKGDDFFGDSKNKTMGSQLRRVLKPGQTFGHEYDFGSTTYLDMKVISERSGRLKNIEIVSRNNMPDFKCGACNAPAKEICTQCVYEDKGLLCEECAKKHECDEEMFLPLVNSPRAGVCGYTG